MERARTETKVVERIVAVVWRFVGDQRMMVIACRYECVKLKGLVRN
jgi:hypothetical protein